MTAMAPACWVQIPAGVGYVTKVEMCASMLLAFLRSVMTTTYARRTFVSAAFVPMTRLTMVRLIVAWFGRRIWA